ncbi:antA/AntB antirepressor family protein (endogenous virus) [Clostridium phage phiCTC2B]|uniref:Phage-related protein n=2 Tax=Clostridium tetani TaxID=1513 RepID=Q892F2_CLOTE|nr:antA/AntB antirepressor family protein [Clostridium tetani]YP_009276902.1 antA/AntB antirepressor family protein [Clostridium phage phiCT19406B]YP_009277346.1 antA/AntB antirepressor family protein [Clostridium phage phiCTC2B]AAO36643.1 phage-related protein [Clostridium tetani E88]AJA42762.1 anti-repressor [Clostridium phage phiCT19406B]AJA42958.1 anti-repressor [Clostridium phage phiCTC2B]KGI41029.1 repressor [Clostridium tetani]KGI45776.1 repressor [Clostridium tetani]
MSNLIKISNKDGQQLVSAKELYLGLGLNKAVWSRWHVTNIEKNEFFKENIDWIGVQQDVEGNETMDFAITLEFAKHIAMMTRTEKSHEYRNYFIECEKKIKKQHKPTCIEDVLIQSLQEMKDVKQQLNQVNNKMLETKEELKTVREVIEIRPSNSWRGETNRLMTKICFKLKDYQKPKEEAYKALEERAGCDLKIRLKNMKVRQVLQGVSKSKIDELNYLDVIAQDKKLIEIYTTIVSQMAIKHKVGTN